MDFNVLSTVIFVTLSLSSKTFPAHVRLGISRSVKSVLSSALSFCLVFDCWNSLLAGCPKNMIYKLQKVQNNAARLIGRSARSDHMSPILRVLHWLPVESRTEYKIIILTFKSSNNQALSYLSDLTQLYIPSRQPSIRLSILDSLVSRRLTSILLVHACSSTSHCYYSGAIYPTLSDTLLTYHHLNLPSRPIFPPLVCVCEGGRGEGVRARVCVESDEKDVE